MITVAYRGAGQTLSSYTGYGFTQNGDSASFYTSGVAPPADSQFVAIAFADEGCDSPEKTEPNGVTFGVPSGLPVNSGNPARPGTQSLVSRGCRRSAVRPILRALHLHCDHQRKQLPKQRRELAGMGSGCPGGLVVGSAETRELGREILE